tara:strand:+ start:412 stop:1317 length:906 start_codon:yes stop_codon:yes gene_type:complete
MNLVEYHNPVLLKQCIEGLNIKPTGIYVDATFGGGGHSRLILKKLNGGKLFAFDQDKRTKENSLNNNQFKLINANFRYLKNFLRMEGIRKIDGLLADLGVSSYQFDKAERGFSIRFEGELDMRMNTESALTAKEVINNYTQQELADILHKYGELKNARIIAQQIVSSRENSEIVTTKDLIDCVSYLVPEKNKNKFLARIFQSVRIEVNDEINSLKEMLNSAVDMLDVSARLVVISYHSLEDRLVKNLVKKGNLEGNLKKDFFGKPQLVLNEINSKVIVAAKEEIIKNSRARSAKLRIAEKV